MRTPTRTSRSVPRTPVAKVLRRRGNACLAVAAVLAVFTASFFLGAGPGWTASHTRLVSAVLASAGAALACHVAAAVRAPDLSVLRRLRRVAMTNLREVTHPGVSHPSGVPLLTPSEQAK